MRAAQNNTLLNAVGDVAPGIKSFFPRPYPFKIGLRQNSGAELIGMEMFEDGISFRSSQPLPMGRMVEMVVAGGHFVVEALIDNCVPNHDEMGGWIVRARFTKGQAHCQEIARLMGSDKKESQTAPQYPSSPSAA